MMDFSFWLLAGAVIGMILMAFLSIGTYQRGYEEGIRLRRPWRAELDARRQAVMDMHARPRPVAVSYSSQPEAMPPAVARAG